jgi:hypothetical protein
MERVTAITFGCGTRVTVRELKPIITEAWRCQGPNGLDPKIGRGRRPRST